MISKKFVVSIFLMVVIVTTLLISGQIVQAQAANNPYSGLAHAVAQKFNLNESDVQAVISIYM